MTPQKDSDHVITEEMKSCAFCGLLVLMSDMLEHTESHMESWGGEELMAENGEHIEESLDENTELMNNKVIKEEIIGNKSQKCSFCPELIEKVKMRDHINKHVAQWDANKSFAEELLSADKDTDDKNTFDEFAESPTEKVVKMKLKKGKQKEINMKSKKMKT